MKKAQFFYLLRRGFFAGGGGEWSTLVNAFKTRVIADGGTLESESCIRDDVKYLIQNPEPVPTPAFTGLLNDYSGAAAAYSLRLLDNTYTGDAIVVRRASDNTTQAIGFVNNELDTTSLESFCSGTDGFVTTWYDQSGNGNDAANVTAVTQPKIVSSGSTILENGKAAIEFNVNWLTTSYPLPSVFSAFNVAKTNFANTFETIIGSELTFNDWIWHLFRSSKFQLRPDSGSYYSGATLNAQKYLINSIYNGDLNAYIDGNSYISQSSVALPSPSGNLQIGTTQSNVSYSFNGILQEIILYDSDQSTNRAGIETNINDHYSIY